MKFLAAVLFTWLSCVPAFATDIQSRREISYNVEADMVREKSRKQWTLHTKNGLSSIINSEAQATGMFKLLDTNVIIRRSEGIITKKVCNLPKHMKKGEKMSPIFSQYLIGKNIWSRCSTMNRKSMKNYQRMESDRLSLLI